MKKKSLKKWIIIGVIVVIIIIIISLIGAIISGVNKNERENANNSYKNSYQYKMEREKNMQVLNDFYGDYIITGVSGTVQGMELDPATMKALEDNMIGSEINIQENNFSIKYHGTNVINGNSFSNENISNPYYEVNQTNESMFQTVYKTGLSNVGISSQTPYFINVGPNNNFEQEIIQDGKGGLLVYSQGVFFKTEAASKILAKKNAQLEKLASDALKTATGTEYAHIFPVEQVLVNGKFEYKNVPSGQLFMCKTKDESLVPDKDTMFINLTEGVVQPAPAPTPENKDKKDNKEPAKPADPNAGKPFYDFTIRTAGMMDQTQANKPTVGKVYLDGTVVITK